MKTFFALACFAAAAAAQRIAIGAPASMSTVAAGSNITVEVDKPNSLSGSTEVGLAIGVLPCGSSPCSSINVTQFLGNIVYSGSFDPQYDSSDPSKPPFQNFSIEIPSTATSGQQLSIGVVHLSIVGASGTPFTEVVNTTVVVQ
ncbi:uncharacterized protein BXZ73DRAFT_79062 [Epithele typhae]|uniref:uncharacterized protein n=1 Tax=Epithele typhae TaxID=378194 RepID=UPI0020074FF5|nr:uncharacterized protein BXZ73DRAFT_79062 [Epithele typhae]KAH9925403.1 hypothetical protein BXZ73DRAFT_79062 [Epithele typhae]